MIDAHFDVYPDRIKEKEGSSPIGAEGETKNCSEEMTKEAVSKKFYNIFLRRARKGQHFHQAYLGCREFPAYVKLVENDEERLTGHYADQEHRDLGWMLWDIEYSEDPQSFTPRFFRAEMRHGVVEVPSEVSV
jgi:CRISPR-associated protein Cas5 subtype I-C